MLHNRSLLQLLEHMQERNKQTFTYVVHTQKNVHAFQQVQYSLWEPDLERPSHQCITKDNMAITYFKVNMVGIRIGRNIISLEISEAACS